MAPYTGYIHEPFNVEKKFNIIRNPLDFWFQYICESNAPKYKKIFDSVLQYQYPLVSNVRKIRTPGNAARILRDQVRMLVHKIKSHTPVVKDPIAFFSAEWLNKTYDMNVLVMIRHPAAFCASLKIKKWAFNFNSLLNQPMLIEKYLGGFEENIREFAHEKKSIVEQAILLWNCINFTVMVYQQEHPEWLFVRHEDLSSDPLCQFQYIFDRFNLDFTSRVKRSILENSGSHNPSEHQPGNEFKRDSKANIYNWKKRLSSDEIECIKDKTNEIARRFYGDHEW